ncbi:MAG: TraB/GumN family protein [Nitrososphaera sp.]
MTKYFSCLCTWLLASFFSYPNAYGQESAKTLPAAWVWQIPGQNRTVYLVGEFHSFNVPPGTSVDFRLGNDVYSLAAEVWVEAAEFATSKRYPPKSLSSQLSPDTWQNVKNMVTSVGENGRMTNPKLIELKNEGLKEMEEQSAFLAYSGLGLLSNLKYQMSRPQKRTVQGLTHIFTTKEKTSDQKKISEIEQSTEADDAWREHCDTNELAEKIVKAGLQYFDLDFFWRNEKFAELHNIFADPTTTEEMFLAHWLRLMSENDLVLQCNVVPRNLVWVPKIVDALQSSGPPIVVLVGAIHMMGEGGLLALLSAKGFTDSRRIYSVPKP